MYCTISVAKTKAPINCAVTAKLIGVFVFAYAKSRFSHDEAQLVSRVLFVTTLGLFVFKGDPTFGSGSFRPKTQGNEKRKIIFPYKKDLHVVGFWWNLGPIFRKIDF